MQVLLDECLPRRLKQSISGHIVATVSDEGWTGRSNGDLLTLAVEKFDVFVTVDRNLPSQQNLNRLAMGIVILQSTSSRFQDLEPLVSDLMQTLNDIKLGDLVRLGG